MHFVLHLSGWGIYIFEYGVFFPSYYSVFEWFYFKHINVFVVGGLMIFFVGMAYLLEHFRNKKP